MNRRREFDTIQAMLQDADAKLVDALERRADALTALRELRVEDPNASAGVAIAPSENLLSQARSFPREALNAVLREVFGHSQALLEPQRISVFGEAGGFAHYAARLHFGSAASYEESTDIDAALRAVAEGRASYAVVPFETSADGALTSTLHSLSEQDVFICAERTVASRHQLLSVTGNGSDVDKICGTRAALASCEAYLRKHFSRASLIDVPSAAMGAEFAVGDHGTAVVGTAMLQEANDLRTVADCIDSGEVSETRYVVVGRTLAPRSDSDRTIVAVGVADEPGALYESLQPFAKRGVNLTRIESRPSPAQRWRFRFFVEFDGHVQDEAIQSALAELEHLSRQVKVLGSYRRPTG